ncbi:MAG: hypothetical protein HKN25_00160 [Pyrinomonadaceae bacterium]|nr:hypothetical protein [Pyrinomonadaceae bacterium]
MSLTDKLQNLAGNSVDELELIYREYGTAPGFLNDVTRLAQNDSVEGNATWLLKKHLESGNKPDEEETSSVWKLLPMLANWEARLHLLQCFSLLRMSVREKSLIESFLRENLGSRNKFVRAWSYSGFYLFANEFPEFRGEARQLIDTALHSESASVKARIRNVTKKGFLADKVGK